MVLHNCIVPTNKKTNTTVHQKDNRPLISLSPNNRFPTIASNCLAAPVSAYTSEMDGNNLVNEEKRRRKRNNTCLQREEEDRCLIAEGEGKISNGC